MDSPSAASSAVVTRGLLGAERLPRVDILRKKFPMPLPELESGIRVLDVDTEGGGGCRCCG